MRMFMRLNILLARIPCVRLRMIHLAQTVPPQSPNEAETSASAKLFLDAPLHGETLPKHGPVRVRALPSTNVLDVHADQSRNATRIYCERILVNLAPHIANKLHYVAKDLLEDAPASAAWICVFQHVGNALGLRIRSVRRSNP